MFIDASRKDPRVFVLRNAPGNQGPPVQFVELPAAVGLSNIMNVPVTHISIFFERDNGKYELITFEQRARCPSGEPLYAQNRSYARAEWFTKEVEQSLERADRAPEVVQEPHKDLSEERYQI